MFLDEKALGNGCWTAWQQMSSEFNCPHHFHECNSDFLVPFPNIYKRFASYPHATILSCILVVFSLAFTC
jgi:hypothetical protein